MRMMGLADAITKHGTKDMSADDIAKLEHLVAAEAMALDVMGRLQAQLSAAQTVLRLLPKLLRERRVFVEFVRDVTETTDIMRSVAKSPWIGQGDMSELVGRLEAALSKF